MTPRLIWHFLAATLVLLCGLGFGVYFLTAAMVRLLGTSDSDLGKTLVAAVVALIGSTLTLVGGKLWEQRVKIREEIRAKKIPIYESHIATFFKVLLAPKLTGKQTNQKEIMDSFAKFAEHMVTWGSTDVIKAWGKCRNLGDMEGLPPEERLDILEDLFMAIRKDVGNDVKSLKNRDLLRLFVNDIPDK